MRKLSSVPVNDSAAIKVIGGHLDSHLIPLSDSDMESSHLPRQVSEDIVAVGEFHSEHSIRENFIDYSLHLNLVCFWHATPFSGLNCTEK